MPPPESQRNVTQEAVRIWSLYTILMGVGMGKMPLWGEQKVFLEGREKGHLWKKK